MAFVLKNWYLFFLIVLIFILTEIFFFSDLLPRDKLIMVQSERICEISCYEKFYTVGTKRMDMIHLNHTGLARLQYFIEDSENVFL